ncbi:unnamed protein product, partial [Agarophyton chilense]
PRTTAPHVALEAVQLGEMHVLKSAATAPRSLAPSACDIVPAVYEGGYKLWECASDLACYILAAPSSLCAANNVLELGAGHALPAIAAAQRAAAALFVHDYNSHVLRDVSMPNVCANVPHVPARFFCGHWLHLPPLLPAPFHLVLSADTVYAPPQCAALARCICACLHPRGVALVAAKTYYFGLNGGTVAFRRHLERAAAAVVPSIRLHVSVVHEVRDGHSNVRQILRIVHQLSSL